MTSYVAFLRGMNLGRRRITNEELGARFEDLGFENVGTFLASGNVVFEAQANDVEQVRRRIEEGLAAALGYEAPTFLRTAAEVRSIARFEPFDPALVEQGPGKIQIALLARPPSSEERAAVLALETGDDLLALAGRELYWLANGGVARPSVDWQRVEHLLGPTTVRTRRTIQRLATKFL